MEAIVTNYCACLVIAMLLLNALPLLALGLMVLELQDLQEFEALVIFTLFLLAAALLLSVDQGARWEDAMNSHIDVAIDESDSERELPCSESDSESETDHRTPESAAQGSPDSSPSSVREKSE